MDTIKTQYVNRLMMCLCLLVFGLMSFKTTDKKHTKETPKSKTEKKAKAKPKAKHKAEHSEKTTNKETQAKSKELVHNQDAVLAAPKSLAKEGSNMNGIQNNTIQKTPIPHKEEDNTNAIVLGGMAFVLLILTVIIAKLVKEDTKKQGVISGLSASLQASEIEIQVLKTKVKTLEEQYSLAEKDRKIETQSYYKQQEIEASMIAATYKKPVVPVAPVTKVIKNYYAGHPSFNSNVFRGLSEKMIGGMTIYEIEISENDNKGYFKIMDHTASQQLAIREYDTRIIPACEYGFDDSPIGKTGIETLQLGEIKKVQDGWEITRKTKIRFT